MEGKEYGRITEFSLWFKMNLNLGFLIRDIRPDECSRREDFDRARHYISVAREVLDAAREFNRNSSFYKVDISKYEPRLEELGMNLENGQ